MGLLVLFALSLNAQAFQAVPTEGGPASGPATQASSAMRRVFVFVEHVDEHGLRSEKGEYFPFGADTRVVDQAVRKGAGKRIAELVFDGDRLVMVLIR
ncbi:hypothetical protein SAMN02746041_00696 [Desulfacinum hydrothermale DSM 13146]|uniref:Uncharacterized protein n=2 Tax=Desulfacinum hydrothermale TaxID=109258 RepID=A0A1W1X6M8_9BACT|nr:hypothetical protein SAMN02746041_00696 [Desulfacinum hydrothermale DSM 13146]